MAASSSEASSSDIVTPHFSTEIIKFKVTRRVNAGKNIIGFVGFGRGLTMALRQTINCIYVDRMEYKLYKPKYNITLINAIGELTNIHAFIKKHGYYHFTGCELMEFRLKGIEKCKVYDHSGNEKVKVGVCDFRDLPPEVVKQSPWNVLVEMVLSVPLSHIDSFSYEDCRSFN